MELLALSRSHRRHIDLFAAMALLATVLTAPSAAVAAFTGLQRVATGLSQPAFSTFAPGDPNRLFIATLGSPDNSASATATIRVLDLTTGVLQTTPYLSIPALNTSSEGGLLGLAFHPDFQTNGKFYVNVTAADTDPASVFSTYIREYTAPSPTSPTANPTFRTILRFSQPQDNHNGGWIGFSPNDGYLYIASGDGGGGNDDDSGHTPGVGNGQDATSNLLGKMLRIDVDGDDFTDPGNPTHAERNYAIPSTNPFLDKVGGMGEPMPDPRDDEIWAYGLRNPFRAGFDRVTGDLWIGDVGQGAREEIDFQPGDSTGGENYGWRLREGFIQTPGAVGGPKPADNVDPIYDYRRPGTAGADPNFTGVTVIGGVPYRGPDPSLQGLYFFADTGSNRIWTLRRTSGPPEVQYVSPQLPFNTGSPNAPVAITEDAIGNIYITYLSGSVYRMTTDEVTPGDFNGDAVVDGEDLAVWQSGYGTTTGDGDADGDGDVDGADFLAWQQNVGWSPMNIAAQTGSLVPEPSVARLLLALWSAVTCHRFRKQTVG
jgi:glucose/arabinose dehydrogenase